MVLSNSHIKGMALMKFLNDEASASRNIDRNLAQLDRRWNTMAKEIIARIELVRYFRGYHKKKADIECLKMYLDT